MPAIKKNFRNTVVRLADLTVTSPVIEQHSFENCLILGPAVIMMNDTVLDGCNFQGTADSILWEIPPERESVIGVTIVSNCEFTGCNFQQVGFAGPAEFIKLFREGVNFES